MPAGLHGYLPDSIDALRDHAERMISASRNQDLIETITEGWPGHGSGDSRLAGHLANLWQIHSDHPPLYRALVMGRHRPVIRALRDRRYSGMSAAAADRMQEPDTLARIRQALECQTLLWCAHDVQMTRRPASSRSKRPWHFSTAPVIAGSVTIMAISTASDAPSTCSTSYPSIGWHVADGQIGARCRSSDDRWPAKN